MISLYQRQTHLTVDLGVNSTAQVLLLDPEDNRVYGIEPGEENERADDNRDKYIGKLPRGYDRDKAERGLASIAGTLYELIDCYQGSSEGIRGSWSIDAEEIQADIEGSLQELIAERPFAIMADELAYAPEAEQ